MSGRGLSCRHSRVCPAARGLNEHHVCRRTVEKLKIISPFHRSHVQRAGLRTSPSLKLQGKFSFPPASKYQGKFSLPSVLVCSLAEEACFSNHKPATAVVYGAMCRAQGTARPQRSSSHLATILSSLFLVLKHSTPSLLHQMPPSYPLRLRSIIGFHLQAGPPCQLPQTGILVLRSQGVLLHSVFQLGWRTYLETRFPAFHLNKLAPL